MTSKVLKIIDYVPMTTNREIYANLATSTIIQAMRDYKTTIEKAEKKEIKKWFESNKKRAGSFVMFIKLIGADIERIREGIYKQMADADCK
jgi:DNA-binding transcriptional regulator YhcF (GntR family)